MQKLAFAFVLISATALGGTFERITPEDGLGRIAFTQLAVNADGDFVAASVTKIFAGNGHDRRLTEILDAGSNASFAISDWRTVNFGIERVDLFFELHRTRAAINSVGDFVLTSNRNLYIGNAKSGQVALVYEAPRFSEFQEVAINEQGQYVATTFEMIIGGSSILGPQVYLEEAVGTFGIYQIWNSTNSFNVESGEKRVVLDDQGRFVAVASSAVYAGMVGEGASLVYEERFADFRQVELTAAGYLVMSNNAAFIGTF